MFRVFSVVGMLTVSMALAACDLGFIIDPFVFGGGLGDLSGCLIITSPCGGPPPPPPTNECSINPLGCRTSSTVMGSGTVSGGSISLSRIAACEQAREQANLECSIASAGACLGCQEFLGASSGDPCECLCADSEGEARDGSFLCICNVFAIPCPPRR